MAWYQHNTSRCVDGETVPGVFLPAIILNFHHFFSLIAVYKDSMIDCWGLCTFDEFLEKIESGWVVNTVPDNDSLEIHHFARIRVSEWDAIGTMDDLIKNVRNAIEELNNRPTAQERVIIAMKAFLENESETNFQLLQTAFDEMPSFYRTYIFGSRFERHQAIQRRLGLAPPDVKGI